MGKKSGAKRHMNPADKERKKQRAQELKRNKKQRVVVRHAIVKGRDPDQLLEQLRKLDQQEFDPKCELSKHVISEKRTKFKGAFIQQLALYREENDSNQVVRLENLLHEYDIGRLRMEQQHRALMCEKDLNLGDIPIPSGYSLPNAAMTPFMPQPPVPPQFKSKPGILKAGRSELTKKIYKHPPGPPPGIPPSFDDDVGAASRSRHVQFSESNEYNYDDYDVDEDDLAPVAMPDSMLPQRSNFRPVQSLISAPPIPPPQSLGYKVYNDCSGYDEYSDHQQYQPSQYRNQTSYQSATVSAAPEIIRPTVGHSTSAHSAHATFSAAPQMRNLKKETTRFVPSSLHVTRPDTSKPKPLVPGTVSRSVPASKPKTTPASNVGKSADEACENFLKEIQGLF